MGKLNKLTDVAADNVSFDPGLSLGDAVSLGRKFAAFAGDQLKTYQLPTVDFETSDGSAVLQIDPVAAAPILDIFRGVVQPATPATDDGVALTPAQVTVSVLNGTGIDGQASSVAESLRAIGFQVPDVGNAPEAGEVRSHAALRRGLPRGGRLLAGTCNRAWSSSRTLPWAPACCSPPAQITSASPSPRRRRRTRLVARRPRPLRSVLHHLTSSPLGSTCR